MKPNGINGSQTVRRRNKKPYRVNLAGVHITCEANYLYIMKLLDVIAQRHNRDYLLLNNDQQCTVKVTENGPYTSSVILDMQNPSEEWLACQNMTVRLYHDVCMAEIVSYQSEQLFSVDYCYPNKKMYHVNEKEQINLFLSEWVLYCLYNAQK